MRRILLAAVASVFVTAAAAERHFRPRENEMVRTIQALAKSVPLPGESGEIAPPVLDAMREASRHELVPENVREGAYENRRLPIGHGQTGSQPYIVALMTSSHRGTALKAAS